MRLVIAGFGGEIPRADATALPDNAAVIASNADLDNGVLAPMAGLTEVATPFGGLGTKTIYRYNPVAGDDNSGYWLEFNNVVDVCPAPVRENLKRVICYSGDGFPRVTDEDIATIGLGTVPLPSNSYRLGVPQPEFTIVATPGTAPQSDELTRFERDYVVTLVCQLGSLLMEGPPSQPTAVVTLAQDQPVTVSGIGSIPAGNYQLHSKRLYRRRVSNGTGTYQLVAELSVGTDIFVDGLADSQISGDVLLSQNWYPPPESLHSIGALPNGLLFGADGNDVLVSEPYRIHAWNPFARYPCNYPVVGLGQAGNVIVAVTAENPFVITGLNPTQMSAQELTIDQGCLSKRSIVSGPFGVAYASPDGIVVINGQSVGVVTEKVFKREQWRELNPSSIVASHLDNRYVFSYTKTNGETGGYIFDPNEPQSTLLRFDQPFTAAYKDSLTDGLFVVANGRIQRFEHGAFLPYQWRSKVMLTRPRSFSAGRIEAGSYNDLTLKLFRDGALVMDQRVTSSRGFRLPAGKGSRWQFELTGTDRVSRLTFADSMMEL